MGSLLWCVMPAAVVLDGDFELVVREVQTGEEPAFSGEDLALRFGHDAGGDQHDS